MKPQKMNAYPSFDDWKHDQSQTNQNLIAALIGIIEVAAPAFTQSVKWGQGCWMLGDAPKIYIHAEEDHLQLGFYAGARLYDPDKLLVGKGKHVRHIKVFSEDDIRPETFQNFIRQIL